MISESVMAMVHSFQQNEETESVIYKNIADRLKDLHDKEILLRISNEEKKHAEIWKKYSGTEIGPDMKKVRRFTWMARIFGYTFAVKKMENGESGAQVNYSDEKLNMEIPETAQIRSDEEKHENALIDILDEEHLRYVGSIVLGLNDALVEISGSLAGFTLAYRNTRMTALAGMITGIAATLSMAASEYLSASSEGNEDAKKSCIYTGVAYLITVALLVLPYLLLPNNAYIGALIIMLLVVLAIISLFNYYLSVAKNVSFKKRFTEMACISVGVSALSFVIGLLVKNLLGIDI